MSAPTKSDVAKAIRQMNRPRSKWGNVHTDCSQGHTHDSKKEAGRCNDLAMYERAGVVKGIQVQCKYPLHVNGHLICTYYSDFEYWRQKGSEWEYVVEDTKGKRTRGYIIKRKLMKAILGIGILET